jgi:hypothetical protein
MHDFQHATADAAADLMKDLKAGGYRVVYMRPKFELKTVAAYDEAIFPNFWASGTARTPLPDGQ